jgi:hypothetical protein
MNRYIHPLVAMALTCVTNPALAGETEPTFSHDVAKIIFDKCTLCHRPDSSGPFSLITYDDVRRRAQTIEAVLDSEYMPPWKPVDHGIPFANSRNLSSHEELTIRQWIDAGCPEGDRDMTPAPPAFNDGWTLGTPDLVVQMNGEFLIPADGPDIYRSFVFPLNLPEDKWVKAVELRPRAQSSVHHAIFFLDTTGNARQLDGVDGKAGISGMGFLADFGGESKLDTSVRRSALWERFRGRAAPADTKGDQAYRVNNAIARGLGGYVPGSLPNLLPGDLAMPLPGGSDIVMQTHFHPSGKAETEQAELALYFADQPPSKQLVPIQIPAMFGFGANIRIPAGESDYRVSDSITLPVDAQAIGVAGHAHYICREMKLTAASPLGETTVLLEIDDWDLDWQDQYLFANPIDLPAGTVLHCEIVYDNSTDNPENPNHPPREIRWGRGSNDEMGSVTLMTVATQQREEPQLQAAVRQHFLATLVHRKGPQLAQMLLQLDDNDDGKLQPSEAPPRMNARIFRFVDADNDGGLDALELDRLMKIRDQLRAIRNR